jgi:hypothetical protein
MKLPSSRLATLALLLLSAPLWLAACSGGGSGAGCAKDSDCKGDRICVDASCQDAPPQHNGNQGNNNQAVNNPQNNNQSTPPPPPPPKPRPVERANPNKVFPCSSDDDCYAPYKCGFQGNCQRL